MLDRLTHGDLVHMMDLATRCLSANTSEDLEGILSGLYDVVSFRKAVLCAVTPVSHGVSIEHFVNHSFGSEWAKVYMREKFERVDPVLRQCSMVNGAFSWSEVMLAATGDACSRFLDSARDFGLQDGATFVGGSENATETRTLLSLAGADPGSLDRILAILTVFGPHLHEAYKRVLGRQPNTASSITLSRREREVLNWKQHGKTYWEIGNILGISQRTVKYHFAHIEAKLDVVSASHAVAKALRMGLIK